ncbi:MAG: tetratricopeptide repeat protein [Clostridia bacterium]|nr:tetratricopeptide repeat protein [Clostridia bacterium]
MMIDVQRLLDRLDALLAAKDYNAAEAHLLYWLREAEATADTAAELTVLNELMGFYRKQGDRAQATKYANYALDRYGVDPEFNDTVFFATTCLNAATVCKAFGETERALELYRRCLDLYERRLEPDDLRFAGLYNNMGLALTEAGQYESAYDAFICAVNIQEPLGPSTAPDRAITFLNLCDLIDAGYMPDGNADVDPAELIDRYIEFAYALLMDAQTVKDAYYAFVCEKCAPVFGYYGYFLYKNRITAEAERVNVQYAPRE